MAFRVILSVALALALAWLGGVVLGEYTFQGAGIQFLPIMGGAGLGAAVAWVVNRVWKGAPPAWMGPLAAAVAAWGEIKAVQIDMPDGVPWPATAWLAIVAAGGVAAYGVINAFKAAARS